MKIRHSSDRQEPLVFIDQQAYDDMMYVTKATKDEVAWFGEVTFHDDEVYAVRAIFLPYQQSNGSTVEIEPEHLEQFAVEHLETHGMDAYNRLRLWGHSHHTMGVTPSGQDQRTVDQLRKAVGDTFLAIRTNHRGQVQVDVSYTTGLTFEDVDVRIGIPDQKRKEHWEALVKERLQRIAYTPPATATSGYWKGKPPKGTAAQGKPSGGAQSGGAAGGNGKTSLMVYDQARKAMVPYGEAVAPMGGYGIYGDDFTLDVDPENCVHEWVEIRTDKVDDVIAECVHCEEELQGIEAVDALIDQRRKDEAEEESATSNAVKEVLDG